jgi:hypothetical protein
VRESCGIQIDDLTRAWMLIEAIDGTIAALHAHAGTDWREQIAELEKLREQTIAALDRHVRDAGAEAPIAKAS